MLIDFGAIKIIAQETQLRSASGTGQKSFAVAKQHYSPPEQLDQDAALDPRADIYALGAVLYRAVAGTPPADADKRKNAVILKNLDSYVPVKQAARIALPAGAAETIDRALSLKPGLRQESIAEFRAALKGNVAETELVKATQLLRPEPMATPGFTSPQAQPAAHAVRAASLPPQSPTAADYQLAPRKTRSWIGIAAGVTVAIILAGIIAASVFRHGDAASPNQTQQQPNTKQNTQNPQRGPQSETDRDTGPDTNNAPQKPIRESEKDTGE